MSPRNNWWEKRSEARSLIHYRDDHSTYLHPEFWDSEVVDLGWEAQYVWFRLLSGPEYQREGFPTARVAEVFANPREIDYEVALESLLRAQLIIHDGDYYTFPNVIWGTPPEGQEES